MKKETLNRITFAIGYFGFYVVLIAAFIIVGYMGISLFKQYILYLCH